MSSDVTVPSRQLTREEFLRQMGLAPDDLAQIPPRSEPDVPELPAQVVRTAGDAPLVIQDDAWVRSTVFADTTLVGQAAQEPTNEAKRIIMESYKATRSGGISSVSSTEAAGTVDERKATDLVTQEDHALASDYKAALLEEFRKRKKNGEAKAPPQVSPPRRRQQEGQ